MQTDKQQLGGPSVAPLDTTAEVETPEHVRFHYRIAGPARRALAYCIDLLIRGVIVYAIFLLLLLVWISDLGEGVSFGAVTVVLFVIEWGYYVLFETLWSGRSPGKRLLRLRVVKEGGYAVNFNDIVLRNLLRAADVLPGIYSVGALVMSLDRRCRRLGDLVAGTMVVVEERGFLGQALVIRPPPTPAELAALPSRPPVSAEEFEAIELFLRRCGRLSPAREDELAQLIAPTLAKRMGVPVADASRLLALIYHRLTVGEAQVGEAQVTAPASKPKGPWG
ncbi:MAG: RDD family protein [Nannocystaceae bacterium]